VNIQSDVIHRFHGGASLVSLNQRPLSSAFVYQALPLRPIHSNLSTDAKLLCQVVSQEQIEHVHCSSGQKSPAVPKTKAVPPGQHFPTLSGSRSLNEPIRIDHMSYAYAGHKHEECDDHHQFPRVPRGVVGEGYHAAHSRAKLGFRQSRPSSHLAEHWVMARLIRS